MKRYGLQVNQGSNYSSAHQPGTRNEFSTFAFRVGHTLIPEGMMPLNGRFTKSAAQEFKSVLFKVSSHFKLRLIIFMLILV